jgi:hypothetical protein
MLINFRKGERIDTDLIAPVPELSEDIRGEHFGVAARYINVGVRELH